MTPATVVGYPAIAIGLPIGVKAASRMSSVHCIAPGTSALSSSARLSPARKESRRADLSCNAQLGLIMSTMTGHTAEYADLVKEKMGDAVSEPVDVGDIEVSSIADYDGFVVGAPTWHTGADVGRSGTSWDEILDEIAGMDLAGKPCAVFGVGDAVGYSENFCDAIEELHDTFSKAGCNMVGYVPADDFEFDDSKSVRDGKFLGLPLDYDNDDDKAEDLVVNWVQQLNAEMKL